MHGTNENSFQTPNDMADRAFDMIARDFLFGGFVFHVERYFILRE